jgi:signal transduction histidine kinase
MAAVGEFSSQIAHELRNPLTAIRMSLQGLHRKLQDSEHARPLEIALQETERLDRVAGGVLSLARAPSGERIWVSAGTLVKGAVESVAAELERLDVRVSFEPGNQSVRLFVHEEALRGALINLLRNAADAMPQGGEVRIAFAIPQPGTVEIHVRDQGPGVSPALAERIFDPFVTSKAKGNGFGLPLAVRAAEANGGSIRVLPPEVGVGAHFVLSVPSRGKAEEQP